MSMFLKLASASALALSLQLIASGTVFASVGPAFAGNVSNGTSSKLSLSLDANSSSKATLHLSKDSTYQPPGDIGSPSRTQGSGTR